MEASDSVLITHPHTKHRAVMKIGDCLKIVRRNWDSCSSVISVQFSMLRGPKIKFNPNEGNQNFFIINHPIPFTLTICDKLSPTLSCSGNLLWGPYCLVSIFSVFIFLDVPHTTSGWQQRSGSHYMWGW